MQISLKRNNFLSLNESVGEKPKQEHRDKSTNCQKSGKFYVEFAKIIASDKSRGVSADQMMKPVE
jgi:hypothetical protein